MTMKTLLMGEHTELPIVLLHMLKLRHGQLIFKGIWNGLVGENYSDLHAVIQVHDQRLIDLLFRNGVLGAAEGFIRGYWSSEDLLQRNIKDQKIQAVFYPITDLYRPVTSGDLYQLKYSHATHTLSLYLNQKLLGQLQNPLAQQYFNIWLGSQPFSAKLKQQLIK